MDADGSKIDFGTGKTPDGEKAVKLTYHLLKGGYAGVWNFLDHTVDISQDDFLGFEAKATVPGPVRMAIKDDQNVTYVTSFLATSTDWVEVTLPLSAFVKDRFATPDNEQKTAAGSAQFDDAVFQNLDPYQQFLKTTEISKKKKRKKSKKKQDEIFFRELQELDVRHLAVAEVLCGPGQEKWGPDTGIDWEKIRTFCLSPMTLGEGVVWVGSIEAFKREKKAAPKPTMTPTPTEVPVLNQPETLVVEELPANLYVQFSDGPGIYQLELLNAKGNHYVTLFRQRISTRKDAWVQWDGKNEQGSSAPPGNYQVELTKDGLFLKKIQLSFQGKNP